MYESSEDARVATQAARSAGYTDAYPRFVAAAGQRPPEGLGSCGPLGADGSLDSRGRNAGMGRKIALASLTATMLMSVGALAAPPASAWEDPRVSMPRSVALAHTTGIASQEWQERRPTYSGWGGVRCN